MKRFSLYIGTADGEMIETPRGEYVKQDDAAELLEALCFYHR